MGCQKSRGDAQYSARVYAHRIEQEKLHFMKNIMKQKSTYYDRHCDKNLQWQEWAAARRQFHVCGEGNNE